jgi:hypothetical protein
VTTHRQAAMLRGKKSIGQTGGESTLGAMRRSGVCGLLLFCTVQIRRCVLAFSGQLVFPCGTLEFVDCAISVKDAVGEVADEW